MWLQFFAQNFHFAVSLFAALVSAAICWLYLDAWMGKHTKKSLLRWVGFASVSLSFLAQATLIEQSVLGASLLGNITEGLIVGLRLAGFVMIIIAEIIDPLQIIPKNTGLDLKPKESSKPAKQPEAPKKPEPAKPQLVAQPAASVKPATAPQPAAAPAPSKPAVAAAPATVAAKPAPASVAAPVAAAPKPAVQAPAATPAAAKPTPQPAPKVAQLQPPAVPAAPAAAQQPKQQGLAVVSAVGVTAKWLVPLAGLAVAVLYWRRATTGLERHLKRPAIGFALIALSDLVALASLLRNTENPVLYSWVAAFSGVWFVGQLLLLAGAIILGIWVWSYLTKRFFSQLFMVLMVTTVIVFFVVTVAFTGLLLRSIRADAVKNLQTAGSVLNYALESKQAETMAGARQLAVNTDVLRAVQAKDHTKLIDLTEGYLAENKQSIMVITNQSGQVLLRGHDAEQWGDSLSDDLLVRRALLGDSRSSVMAYKSVGAPTIQVRSAAIIRAADGTVAGSVLTGVDLGSGFVDSVKHATGWQASIYAGNTLAATTVVDPDGKTRSTGLVLNDGKVMNQVLKEGKSYAGTLRLQNREVLGAFLPLKDVDNASLGMLMISEPQSSILRTAGRSIELTFLLTGLLIMVSVIPIYWVTKIIEKQLD